MAGVFFTGFGKCERKIGTRIGTRISRMWADFADREGGLNFDFFKINIAPCKSAAFVS